MYILTIIPIARGIPFDTLSYYANSDVAVGTIVSAPFNRQTIFGITTECIPLAEAKTFVKQANFALKKIKQVVGTIPIISQTALAIKDTAHLTLIPLGAIAGNTIQQTLFEYVTPKAVAAQSVTSSSVQLKTQRTSHADTQTDTIDHVLLEKRQDTEYDREETVTSGPRTERSDYYKRQIRSAFAEKKSVLFIAPTIRSLTQWKDELEKGISKNTIILHSKITKKTLRSAYSLIKQHDHPLIIFATPACSVMPCEDIGLIIAEDESSNLYKTSDRFGLDYRIFIRQFASRNNISLQWGDTIPRFETLARLEKEQLPRSFIPEKCMIVPITPYRTVLPKEVIDTLRHAYRNNKRVYIHSARKGIAPLSRCSDCGTVVSCPQCQLPMILRAVPQRQTAGQYAQHNNHTENIVLGQQTSQQPATERSFLCTHCTTTLPTTYTCSHCTSWNIAPLAIGTESIRDAVQELLGPAAPVITIDDDITPDTATVQQMIERTNTEKNLIVIGTIKVLPYLKEMDYCLFPFIDRLLSIPSLYTTEQVLRLIMLCDERTNDSVVLFTKYPDFGFLSHISTYKINTIVQEELTIRKELGYPPYGSLVKITVTAPEQQRTTITERINDYLQHEEYSFLRARRVQGTNKLVLSWLIKGQTTFIEDKGSELSLFLNSLRTPYTIEENPEAL